MNGSNPDRKQKGRTKEKRKTELDAYKLLGRA